MCFIFVVPINVTFMRSLYEADIYDCIIKYNVSTCYSRNFKTLASRCCCIGRFESYVVANPEDKFFHDEAHLFDAVKKLNDQSMKRYHL